jgi:hypothetical protein
MSRCVRSSQALNAAAPGTSATSPGCCSGRPGARSPASSSAAATSESRGGQGPNGAADQLDNSSSQSRLKYSRRSGRSWAARARAGDSCSGPSFEAVSRLGTGRRRCRRRGSSRTRPCRRKDTAAGASSIQAVARSRNLCSDRYLRIRRCRLQLGWPSLLLSTELADRFAHVCGRLEVLLR